MAKAVIGLLVGALEGKLRMVEAGVGEFAGQLLVDPDAGSDEVGVKPALRGVTREVTMSRRAVGSPPERCTCSAPSAAASLNTRFQVSPSSSLPGRSSAIGFEQ